MTGPGRPVMSIGDWLGCVLVGAAGMLFVWLMIATSGWAGLAATLFLVFVTITALCVITVLTGKE